MVQDIAEVIELGNGKKLTASQFLQHFLFTPETQHSYVYKLSGGAERRRLYLCTVLMRNPNFLVLDEPTNDLDIITLQVLEEYFAELQGLCNRSKPRPLFHGQGGRSLAGIQGTGRHS